jgi:hypothetical protein
MPKWTESLPTTPGLYWVWQPEEAWPCKGEVRAVEVDVDGGELQAWIPFMDYADAVRSDTWLNAKWLGPFERPPAPPQARPKEFGWAERFDDRDDDDIAWDVWSKRLRDGGQIK